MPTPQISIILPTYNRAEYLSDAINSILNQTFDDFELLIIDDGSTDNTASIVEGFSDKRISYFKFATNQGVVAGRNHGIDHAKGKYIALMDSDDISELSRLAEQFHFMEKNLEIGICGTGFTKFNQEDLEVYAIPTDIVRNIRPFGLFSPPLNHPTCMIRKRVLQQYDIRYVEGFRAAEDYYFMLQILKHTKAHIIPKSLYQYRVHQFNTSIKERIQQIDSCKKVSYLAFQDNFGDAFSESEHASIFNLFSNIPIQAKNHSVVEKTIRKFLEILKAHPTLNTQPLTKIFTLKLLKFYEQQHSRLVAIIYLLKSGVWLKNTPKELIEGLFKRFTIDKTQ